MKKTLKNTLIQILLGVLIGLLCGLSVAAFLFCLEKVTNLRIANRSITFFLPLAGIAIGFCYDKWGVLAVKGNNLVLNAVHDESVNLPKRMGPMVFLATAAAHLFGASVGREGAAVQIGAVLASLVVPMAKIGKDTKKALIMAGVAGGFSAAFGAPLAGTVFALEVSHIRKYHVKALPAVLPAAFVGDFISRFLLKPGNLPVLRFPALNMMLTLKFVVFSFVIAAFCILFIETVHLIKMRLGAYFKSMAVTMFLGGIATLGLWLAVGSNIYLGLGASTINKALTGANVPWGAFIFKLMFTSVALGSGFVGGEVTPLFFMGSTLGNAYGKLLRVSPSFMAGLGLVALFGAAANAPLAMSVLAAELFGYKVFPFALLVCFLSAILSGEKRGIYLTQRVFHHEKNDWITIEELREIKDNY